MILKSDFHIHSCVSPFGVLDLSAFAIAETLAQKGVQLAALTDHNTALNCPAFAAACKKNGIACLFGMEVQSAEEVHILTLFSDLDKALAFGEEVYSLLPDIKNVPEKTGDQVYVDEEENILGEVEKYLITSTSWQVEEVAAHAHKAGGIVIPAHVDRAAFSLSSQFGFILDGDWDALEVVRIPSEMNTLGYPLTTSSDAHYIEHIARRPFELDIGSMPLTNDDGTVNLETIRKALQLRPR
ncbi:MAG: PHP domain-containing protein [Spirochaetaceae bacterium]|nr:PHP domain-containing protein [Spirochaetaceae bacterium]